MIARTSTGTVVHSNRALHPIGTLKSKAWYLALLLLVVGVLHAQEDGEKPGETGTSSGPCVGVTVTSLNGGGGAEPGEFPRPFSISEILDLHFNIQFQADFEGEDLIFLRVYTPQGHLYQEMAVPFSTDPGRAGRARSVQGYPRPLKVRGVERGRANRPSQMSTPFPVGGTVISSRSMTGTWRVEALLGESRATCGSGTTFTLSQ